VKEYSDACSKREQGQDSEIAKLLRNLKMIRIINPGAKIYSMVKKKLPVTTITKWQIKKVEFIFLFSVAFH
jgi:hypothetical protein